MSNNRIVRDTKAAKLKGNSSTAKPSDQVQLNHDNAPLLTVKFLELILREMKKITEKLEKVDG